MEEYIGSVDRVVTEEKQGKTISETIEEIVRKPDLHGGHRKRILERMKKGGLCPHEYLEVLLFSALPRRNTNDLAHRLLSEFVDFKGIFKAPVEQLMQVEGVGENLACFLRTIGVIIEDLISQGINPYPEQFALGAFARFMCREYGSLKFEILDVFALDAVGGVVGRRRCSSLTEGRVEVKMPWLVEMLTHYKPSGLIIVHNHPFGAPLPSGLDDETTAECRSLCEKNGVIFCDHFIYSPQGIYSYNLGRALTATDLTTEKGEDDDAEKI